MVSYSAHNFIPKQVVITNLFNYRLIEELRLKQGDASFYFLSEKQAPLLTKAHQSKDNLLKIKSNILRPLITFNWFKFFLSWLMNI